MDEGNRRSDPVGDLLSIIAFVVFWSFVLSFLARHWLAVSVLLIAGLIGWGLHEAIDYLHNLTGIPVVLWWVPVAAFVVWFGWSFWIGYRNAKYEMAVAASNARRKELGLPPR
jgi:hypothetical protein